MTVEVSVIVAIAELDTEYVKVPGIDPVTTGAVNWKGASDALFCRFANPVNSVLILLGVLVVEETSDSELYTVVAVGTKLKVKVFNVPDVGV